MTQKYGLAMIGFLLLWASLIFACVRVQTPSPTEYSSVLDYEMGYDCGPSLAPPQEQLHDHFLHWTADGRWLVFDYGHGSWNEPVIGTWIVDRKGTQVRAAVEDANPGYAFSLGFYADVSPDGKRIVYSTCQFPNASSTYTRNQDPDVEVAGEDEIYERGRYQYEIAVVSLAGGEPRRLTRDFRLDHYPVWSPDGKRIIYVSNPETSFQFGAQHSFNTQLFSMAVDGTDVQRITPPELKGVVLAPPVWSPDGERLAFLVNEGEYWQFRPYRKTLYTVRIDGTVLTRIAEDAVSVASWSPDGQRLAVAKYFGDYVGLFTLAADGSDERLITTITEREELENSNSRYKFAIHTVSWSPDGKQILYSCDLGACVVDIESGVVTGLVEDVYEWGDEPYIAAWSPDGDHIAIYTPGGNRVELQLYTVARDGTDRRDLLRLDEDGNLVPANLPE